jgi:hypothetical protein
MIIIPKFSTQSMECDNISHKLTNKSLLHDTQQKRESVFVWKVQAKQWTSVRHKFYGMNPKLKITYTWIH